MSESFPAAEFADVVAGNDRYVEGFADQALTGRAARGLAVVTCMDSRIDPLALLGMAPGDVKILRNAGARVTDDVLRTLMLASYLLGVERVLVMPHTDCRMATSSEEEIHSLILRDFGVDTRSVKIRTVADQRAALVQDVLSIRTYALLPKNLIVGGAIYDVRTGHLDPIV
jgi:carbonic anhydrase